MISSVFKTLARVTLAAVSSAFVIAGAAAAQGTDAGTSVDNTFTLDYSVNSVAQDRITNAAPPTTPDPNTVYLDDVTSFTVDRKIDLTLSPTLSTVNVSPGDGPSVAQMTFTLTNTGNDNQSYSFNVSHNTAGSTASGSEAFVTENVVIEYSLNGGTSYTAISSVALGSGSAGSAAIIPDIAPGGTALLRVSGDIPTTAEAAATSPASSVGEGATDPFIVVAETRDPSAWTVDSNTPTQGALTLNDANSVNDDGIDNVFVDGDGGVTGDAAGTPDGRFGTTSELAIITADLTATKEVFVVSTALPDADCAAPAVNPTPSGNAEYPVPGACVEYVITVANGGSVTAAGVAITDRVPDNLSLVYVELVGTPGFEPDSAASASAISVEVDSAAVPSGGVISPPIVCDGSTTCLIEISDAELDPATTGVIVIRATVD
ncbi:MAG: hypothetical protein AAFY37_05120 [Pseudomonadota bacterium]